MIGSVGRPGAPAICTITSEAQTPPQAPTRRCSIAPRRRSSRTSRRATMGVRASIPPGAQAPTRATGGRPKARGENRVKEVAARAPIQERVQLDGMADGRVAQPGLLRRQRLGEEGLVADRAGCLEGPVRRRSLRHQPDLVLLRPRRRRQRVGWRFPGDRPRPPSTGARTPRTPSRARSACASWTSHRARATTRSGSPAAPAAAPRSTTANAPGPRRQLAPCSPCCPPRSRHVPQNLLVSAAIDKPEARQSPDSPLASRSVHDVLAYFAWVYDRLGFRRGTRVWFAVEDPGKGVRLGVMPATSPR